MGLHGALVHPSEPLDGVPAAAFGGGVAAFFGALVAMRVRRREPPGPVCIAAALVGAGVAVVAREIDAVISVVILAIVAAGTTLIERRVRQSRPPEVRHPA